MPSVPHSDDTWVVPGVYLLTEGPDGRAAVPDLELTFLDDGITVDKSDGEGVWKAAWSDLAEVSTVERAELPEGGGGVVIVVVERGGRRPKHRFVLPSDDPDMTESSIHDRARAHRLRTNKPKRPVSRALTTVMVLAAAATLTALLLSAVHVIHF
jgi:hypothetical protein